MSIDDLVARHRPDDRLSPAERARLLAAFAATDETDRGPVDSLVENLVTPLPLVDGGRPRPPRAWLPAVAAAAVVALGAGGLAAWRLTDDRPTDAASESATAATCTGTLPASWGAARSTAPLRVDGHDAVPHGSTASGTELLSWDPTPTTIAFGLRAATGGVTRVATFPRADSDPRAYTTDGRHVVFGLSPHGTDITDVQLVDATTGARRHLLADAPMPAGWVVRTDVAIFGGFVYWGATPGPRDDRRGVVIRYSISDHTYRVLAQLDRFPTVLSDVRGVAWPTGSVTRNDLPAALNPLLDAGGHPTDRLVTDGTAYAWQPIDGDQTVFHWADGSGETRTFRVSIDADHDGAALTAVSGPFLFFHVNKARGTESVLDTRTGALARTGTDEEVWSAPGHHVYAMAGAFEYHAITPAALPGFGCD